MWPACSEAATLRSFFFHVSESNCPSKWQTRMADVMSASWGSQRKIFWFICNCYKVKRMMGIIFQILPLLAKPVLPVSFSVNYIIWLAVVCLCVCVFLCVCVCVCVCVWEREGGREGERERCRLNLLVYCPWVSLLLLLYCPSLFFFPFVQCAKLWCIY